MIVSKEFRAEEIRALEELEGRVADVIEPDMLQNLSLYRFLKARDFDVCKAEKMLRKHLLWRKANQMDSILEEFEPKEFFRRYIEPTTLGLDKEGDVVWYAPFGKMEAKDILKCEKKQDYIKHWLWFTERHKETFTRLADKENRTMPQLCAILDLDKLTFGNATSKATTDLCVEFMTLLQDNYPEVLKSVYIINSPGYFVILFSILKAFMSQAMLQKISVFGHSDWKEKLPEVIDVEVLPAFLGGNRTDPDGNPLCKTFVNHSGQIDPCYYLSPRERYFADKSRVAELVVPRSGKKEVCVDVSDGQSAIHWEFLVSGGDVGFGLIHEGVTELLPVQRYHTSDGTQKGSYRTRLPGKYILVFDNSYSWFSPKEVEYCIDVV